MIKESIYVFIRKEIQMKRIIAIVVGVFFICLFFLTANAASIGDVDGDKTITAGDARLALRAAVGLEAYDFNSGEYKACDVDFDGQITAADARLILRAAVGLETLSTNPEIPDTPDDPEQPDIPEQPSQPSEEERLAQFNNEYEALYAQYQIDVSVIQKNIEKCNEEITRAQIAIANANNELSTLSPTAPSWYIQSFVSEHWREYGNTYAATEEARRRWTAEYNSKVAQLNATISNNQTALTIAQTNLMVYSSQLQTVVTTFEANVSALKQKYGIS